MFEKEAEEWVIDNVCKDCSRYEKCKSKERCTCKECSKEKWQKGAEFGYNKVNEWNTETPSSSVGNKDLLLRVAKDDFDVGYYHFENQKFYTNDGREVTPLAWKVIVPPERKPEVEG